MTGSPVPGTCTLQTVGLFLILFAASPALAQIKLLTVAEQSQFQATAPHADVVDFCDRLAAESKLVNGASMGKTHEGRDIPLLILADPPIGSAAEARNDDRPVVFAMANIHAGEVCGKEALMMLARDFVRSKSSLLNELIIVFAPIYNADGNERFSTSNRPNQIGPAKGKGQRPNAQGLDLNRDHMKLESPEARSLAKLLTDWKPVIAIDCHTTNGSWHRYALTYDTPRHPATDRRLLEFARDKYLPTVSQKMKADSKHLTFYYGNFSRDHRQWKSYPAAPRYSTHYFGLRNCIGILSEAYAYDTYEQRVRSTYAFVHQCLKFAANNKKSIITTVDRANKDSSELKEVPVRFEPDVLGTTFSIAGYKEDSAGGGRAESANDIEQDYEAKYFGVSKPTLSVRKPAAYLIPSDRKDVIDNLVRHGIRIQKSKKAVQIKATTFEITDFRQAEKPFQGHRMVSNVTVRRSTTTVDSASYTIVPGNQAAARLIVNLLEPESADGLCAWNLFDSDLATKTYPVLRIESPAELSRIQ